MKRFVIGLLFLLLAGCTTSTADSLPVKDVTVFKSPSCGCCGIYSQYLEKEGFRVNVREVPTMDSIKEQFGVPEQLRSCHTAQVGKYFVEGHVPTEAVAKLLEEQPDIAGIAMPGMPSGSPGMAGKKTERWVIYAVDKDGSYEEFMTF